MTDTLRNDHDIVKQQNNEGNFPVIDLNQTELPNLADAEIMPIELTTLYWTPEMKGESKRVYFDNIILRQMPALNEAATSDEPVILPCAYFFEQTEEGIIRICNASKRLVAALEGNFVRRGTPLIIKYLGKVKNNTNAFKSDAWSVMPLKPNVSLISETVSQEVKESANGATKDGPVGFDEVEEIKDSASVNQPNNANRKPGF